EGLRYSAIPPPPAQVYSPSKKDISWTGLPEFKDDSLTDYNRPSHAIESTSNNSQNRNLFVTETEASPNTISPKPFIKFVKETDRSTETKTAKVETTKPAVKYAAMYSKPSKSLEEGLRYSAIPPPPAQVYSPSKKDISWTGLPEFKDDSLTDYNRPSHAIE
nr:hypothetical protein [Tanacetum cinerariifolium]